MLFLFTKKSHKLITTTLIAHIDCNWIVCDVRYVSPRIKQWNLLSFLRRKHYHSHQVSTGALFLLLSIQLFRFRFILWFSSVICFLTIYSLQNNLFVVFIFLLVFNSNSAESIAIQSALNISNRNINVIKPNCLEKKRTDFYRFVSTLFYFSLLFLWIWVNYLFFHLNF